MKGDDIWIHSSVVEQGWLAPDTPPGIFVISGIPEGAFAWVLEGEPKNIIYIAEQGTNFQLINEFGADLSGVHIGPVELLLNPHSFTEGDGRALPGEIVLRRGQIVLAYTPGHLSYGPRFVPVRGGENTGVRYDVRCTNWSLGIRNPQGKISNFFERRG